MKLEGRIPEATLHSFVDRRLTSRDERDVAAALQADPALSSRTAIWARQSETLRTLFEPVVHEPLPLNLLLQSREPPAPQGEGGNIRVLLLLAFVIGVISGAALAWGLQLSRL